MQLIKHTVLFLFIILFVSCKCNDIDCETGPPKLNVQLVDSIGVNPILSGALLSNDVKLQKTKQLGTSYSNEFEGIISFSLDNESAEYVLLVKNIPIDTLLVTTKEFKSECCSNYAVTNVSINKKLVEFRPFVTLEY